MIINDWGLGTLTDGQRQDLLEVMEDRDGGVRSTVITGQLPRDAVGPGEPREQRGVGAVGPCERQFLKQARQAAVEGSIAQATGLLAQGAATWVSDANALDRLDQSSTLPSLKSKL